MPNRPSRKPKSQDATGQVVEDRTVRARPRRAAPPPRRAAWVRRRRGALLGTIGLIVILALAIILALKATIGGGTHAVASDQPASAALVSTVTQIPQSTYDAVGSGSASPAPKAINAPAVQSGGKPEVLYVGAEWCPFCAAERWAMVAALSRFGTFTNLSTTRSSSTDVYPSTATFSFYGSTYKSQYVVFTPVEEFTNQTAAGGGYQPLQQLSSDQQQIVSTYDAPPYLASAGSIPFMDFGGKYVLQGATYSPTVLAGQDWSQIAAKLSQPSSDAAKGIVGSANLMTAAICTLTSGQPANVCQAAGTKQGASKLGGQ